jgi:hypothetical protein
MSSTSAPFGLRPVYHPSGTLIPITGTIASGYSSNIFLYSPVAYNNGVIELAAAGSRAVGTFLGVQYTDVNGRRQFSNKWPASTSATDIVCWLTSDPATVYTIQANGSITESDIGEQADWSTNDTSAGNTTTGLSSVTLATGTLTDSGNAGLRIIGITENPDNDWGDAFTVVNVQISEHQFVADRVAI